ncbi:MAG: hypothetical protein M3Z35_16970 [Nitrospirota bacterium]|nr:hypothetical protein [Nitrospirota bacterium]
MYSRTVRLAWRQPRHDFPYPRDPCSGNALLVSGRDHLSLGQVVEAIGIDCVPGWIIAILFAVT